MMVNDQILGQFLPNSAQYQQKYSNKVIGRPFKKGISGNPYGKPRGRRNFATVFNEAISTLKDKDGNSVNFDDVVKASIEQMIRGMQKGDPKYFKLYTDALNRIYGKPKRNKSEEIHKVPVITGVRIVYQK